ncbi:MAG: alpha/beta hydrolase, partial [Bacteriovoracaceae bacterium]|nr:alpha/beta hydrolase [Bacteriovoracaceae bacterium]
MLFADAEKANFVALKITPHILKLKNFTVQALSFYYPKAEAQNNKPFRAIFTHGYTASKSDQLTWATRLAEAGIPTIIFDLPGHYLSS